MIEPFAGKIFAAYNTLLIIISWLNSTSQHPIDSGDDQQERGPPEAIFRSVKEGVGGF